MTDQEIFIFDIQKTAVRNDGAGSITNHLKLKLEQSQSIKSCHIDSVSFVPDNDKYIVTLVISDIVRL
jgi:hypothetical protein